MGELLFLGLSSFLPTSKRIAGEIRIQQGASREVDIGDESPSHDFTNSRGDQNTHSPILLFLGGSIGELVSWCIGELLKLHLDFKTPCARPKTLNVYHNDVERRIVYTKQVSPTRLSVGL